MLSQDELWLLKEKYGGEKSAAFFADCERLAAGEPLAYLIGHAPFLNCTIHLDSRPLIPRPETEFWVEHAITHITAKHTSQKSTSPRSDLGLEAHVTEDTKRDVLGISPGHMQDAALRILDLCAGSGCIGIAVAKRILDAHVTFAEIDSNHLPTIEKNIYQNLLINHIAPSPRSDLGLGADWVLAERFSLVQSNLFHNLGGVFDIILSNPPYIDPALDRTEPSVKTHEPHQALYGGRAGLECITAIITGAPAYLTPHGQLWIEHEPEQSRAIRERGAHYNFSVTTHTDQYQQERFSILVLQ